MKVLVENACSSRHGTGDSRDRQQTIIPVTQDTCVSEVRIGYCDKNGIRQKREYVLLNDKGEILDDDAPISACGVLDEDVLYLAPKYGDSERTFGLNNYVLLSGIALIIGLAGITAITILYIRDKTKPGPYDYGIAFDAGSTHTQLFVYRWSIPKVNNSGDVAQVSTTKCNGLGINRYSERPSAAGEVIGTCLQSAQNSVPEMYQQYTPVYLGATAGMRLLHEANSTSSASILSSVRSAIASSPYQFTAPEKQARIISGQEEGTFSWLTANYLLRDLKKETSGALDMGGASTQITFIPDADVGPLPSDYARTVLVHGTDYTVYTHSYLCYGSVEAQRRHRAALILNVPADASDELVNDPCLARGASVNESTEDIFKVPCVRKHHSDHTNFTPFSRQNLTYTFNGTGNVSACYETVSDLFNFTSCNSSPNCTFNGVYQPKLYGQRFFAFSSFYYTMDFLNVTSGNFTKSQVKHRIDAWCRLPYSEISDRDPSDQYLLSYCFNAIYIYTLLVNGYKFNDDNWNTLVFTNNVAKSDLGWSLGFMLNETNHIDTIVDESVVAITVDAFALLMSLFIIFLIISAAFACYTIIQHRHKRRHTRRDYARLQEPQYGSI